MSDSELTVAIEGCCHGELDKIYATIKYLKQVQNVQIDLLICCGDFQAVRNAADLMCLACPPKYRDMNTFYKYYSGEAKAPVPTLFIGGNHEAINHLTELYYGGWVAPNIYFLGFAGVVNFGGIRIGGLSGIYSQSHYKWNHQELPPYDARQIKSAYHLREFDVYKLKQLNQKNNMDIFLSHDWPAGITDYGDLKELLRRKSFLQKEIERGDFGSPPAMELMDHLKPEYWFSAHMHTKFTAIKEHKAENGGKASLTKFLALDKCLPGRDFLQVVRIPGAKGPKIFQYDPEWLAIVHATHNYLNWGLYGNFQQPGTLDLISSQDFVNDAFKDLTIPNNFSTTVPRYHNEKGKMPRKLPINPQTTEFLEKLGLQNNIGQIQQSASSQKQPSIVNEEEIKLSEDDQNLHNVQNDEEINLSAEEDNNEEILNTDEELHIDDLEDEDEGMDDVIDVEDVQDELYIEENKHIEILNSEKSTKNDSLINSSEKRGENIINDVQTQDEVAQTKQQGNLQEIQVDKQQINQFEQQEKHLQSQQ